MKGVHTGNVISFELFLFSALRASISSFSHRMYSFWLIFFKEYMMHQVYFMYDWINYDVYICFYVTCQVLYQVIHVYEHVSIALKCYSWHGYIYILYMFVICASTCIALNCLFGQWTKIGLCVYCVSFAICVLVIYQYVVCYA